MAVTRRNFAGSAVALSFLSSLFSPRELEALQQSEASSQDEEFPHSSTAFWSGFFDSVNPWSPNYGQKAQARGVDSLVDPTLETQYLHYETDSKQLHYATAIDKTELLDHDGDVSASILMNQFRPSTTDAKKKDAAQFRVDATQNHPFMNLLTPLAWTALASLKPNDAGKIPSLDQLGFKSDQVMNASTHILMTQGSGTLAINISRAQKNSAFLKVFNKIIEAAKIAAPFIGLPAVSVPAISTFSEALSYWEDRTQFLINGNLVNVYATQQAMSDMQIKSPAIGLVSGDYVVVAKKDTGALEAFLSKMHIFQGYLVLDNTDLNQPLDKVASDPGIPDITYATVRVSVSAVQTSNGAAPTKAADSTTPKTKSKGTSKK